MGLALGCTIAVKFSHAWRSGMLEQVVPWVLADVAILGGLEAIMAATCFLWPIRLIFRINTSLASIVCLWSIINAAWLTRTGTQIFPEAILPLIRDPINVSLIVAINLIKHPVGSVALLVPCLFAIWLVLTTIVKPVVPTYRKKAFLIRIMATATIALAAVPARGTMIRRLPSQTPNCHMHHNSHLRAVFSLFKEGNGLTRQDLADPPRTVPPPQQLWLNRTVNKPCPNVLVVVLEGVAYRYTSLAGTYNTTLFLLEMAQRGVEFTSMRSTVTHTTKALFAILTGRYPSACQDVVEAIPDPQGYASLATILANQLGYRTAFFQSAKGTFEARPGLVSNLGFETFQAREALNTKTYLGYLAADEFALLPNIRQWIEKNDQPFLLVVMCSATHDPYEVPEWFEQRAKEPLDRYLQTIRYTDQFLAALYRQLGELGNLDKTIFCVVGDHGEAFGEHGLLGHDMSGFDEALHVPWLISWPLGIQPGTKICQPVSSVDVCPTILGLLGFQVDQYTFDGADCIGQVLDKRPVYFSCWANEGPAGFVLGSTKYLYDGTTDQTLIYDLAKDPAERNPITLTGQMADAIKDKILSWRRSTLLKVPDQTRSRILVYDRWLVKPVIRDATCRYRCDDQ